MSNSKIKKITYVNMEDFYSDKTESKISFSGKSSVNNFTLLYFNNLFVKASGEWQSIA